MPLHYCTVGNGSYGLGLILSHGYLLAHGGELWMTSEGAGKGDTVVKSIKILLDIGFFFFCLFLNTVFYIYQMSSCKLTIKEYFPIAPLLIIQIL